MNQNIFVFHDSYNNTPNDYLALELKSRGAKLININPDQSANNIAQAEAFIPLKSGDAFPQLNALIS